MSRREWKTFLLVDIYEKIYIYNWLFADHYEEKINYLIMSILRYKNDYMNDYFTFYLNIEIIVINFCSTNFMLFEKERKDNRWWISLT